MTFFPSRVVPDHHSAMAQRALSVCIGVMFILPVGARLDLHAQDSTRIAPLRLVTVSTLTLGTGIGVHIYQQNAWWQGERAPFQFENDWTYALNIDKFGHAYGAYLLSNLFTYSLSWSGFDRRSSVFYGSMLGLGYQLYVEVEDGYHKAYGFSPGDAFADVVGAMVPLAQEAYPVLRNVRLKWSYWPSSQYKNELSQGQSRVFIDDYQGQIYWLGVDPHFMMGDGLRSVVPDWLGLSFGAAVRNLDTGGGEKLFYLTLDYNLANIRTQSDFLHSVLTALDFLHFPAPGIGLEGGRFKVGVFY